MRDRVALVTPAARRRHSAESWEPLLSDRAEIWLCESPGEDAARSADLVVIDQDCPDLERWIRDASVQTRDPDSIVVFGGPGSRRPGAVAWGKEGTQVLATIADFLDRRRLLRESDEFLEELRTSNERLDAHRRRFSRLVLEQAESLRGANASLSREVEQLTRLQGLARFFASPGPSESFADRLCETVGTALRAAGVALARRNHEESWAIEAQWRISRKNARGILSGADARKRVERRPSTRKGTEGWWIRVDASPAAGLVVLARAGQTPGGDLGDAFVDAVRSLVADGFASRADTEELLSRKAQSERILQTLRGGLLRVDGSGTIALANPACARILDTSVSALEGRAIDEAFARDLHVRDLLLGVARDGGTLDDVETHLTAASGRRVSVSVRASALSEAEGGGVLVLLSDLSRRKEVEEQIRRADRLAALGRLSAGVAHEIRNPLAGIRTTAEILRNRIAPESRRFVDVILEETQRLDRIVGSLLQFAKPARPRVKPVCIVELLERAQTLATGRAVDRGVTIRVEGGKKLPSPLADPDQILQVFLNVLLNGVEATPAGRVVRATAAVAPNGADVRVVVEDGGEGVSPAIRERVFDPFFTTKPGGTGLGLSISQNILRQHGGSLRLEADEEGSRATVTLPLRAAEPRTGARTWPTS